MKVRLLRDARILHKAGEVVEVSPSEFQFLVSLGSAVEGAVNPPAKVETATKEPVKAVEKRAKKK